ncbi:hypothetical protein BA190_32885 [Labrys sp. WJW]|uniref:alpha/beta hydrolase n=1 Tax=Labrys sp. WJW TaxID=1737983 RepID=UPI0008352CA8|nr:alpha/beta hydrolase-fold protein [Labrys sp. WJW]OCC00657.1 hypothetical protein BA190_32885 [Labrys sp. WJW]
MAGYARAESHRVATNRGRTYLVNVALPEGAPPPQGFPIVYVLDAGACFGTMLEAVRMQSRRPARTGVEAAIVVGIGYDTQETFDIDQRLHDLTPSVTQEFPGSGGANEFLDFLETDLLPACERRYTADPRRRLLFGHSLGGLFALHVLFTRPYLFSSVAAASPSLWWDGGALKAERLFCARYDRLAQHTRLLICIGALERGLPAGLLKLQPNAGDKHMVDRARELATRLQALNDPLLNISFVEFADENHASVVPAAISRSLRLLTRLYPEAREGAADV